MRALLDSHICLWWFMGKLQEVSPRIESILKDPETDLFFSPVFIYEIQYKATIGKLHLPKSLSTSLVKASRESGWKELTINTDMMHLAGKFCADHRDPFDRILAAQALHEKIPIISADSKLDLFEVERIW